MRDLPKAQSGHIDGMPTKKIDRLSLPEYKEAKCNGSFTLVRILQWTVVFLQRDRNFSISALMQSTAENADCCSKCELALKLIHFVYWNDSVVNKDLKCSLVSYLV